MCILILRVAVAEMLSVASSENELAEIVTIGDHEFKEVIEEYDEEILVQEEVLKPPMTD